jgi:hypothetical protein
MLIETLDDIRSFGEIGGLSFSHLLSVPGRKGASGSLCAL